jgi:hypothetical protein
MDNSFEAKYVIKESDIFINTFEEPTKDIHVLFNPETNVLTISEEWETYDYDETYEYEKIEDKVYDLDNQDEMDRLLKDYGAYYEDIIEALRIKGFEFESFIQENIISYPIETNYYEKIDNTVSIVIDGIDRIKAKELLESKNIKIYNIIGE